MEELQRLAEEISKAFIKYLKESNGNTLFESEGLRGEITVENLAHGLVVNALSAAKGSQEGDIELAAYRYLAPLINIFGSEYRITEHGLNVINTMARGALKKNTKPEIH